MSRFTRGFACLSFFIAALLIAPGCPTKRGPVKDGDVKRTDDSAGKKDKHTHPDKGPHDGALAEWGDEEYHAEFVVEHSSKQATVYILDGGAKKAAPIAAESITLSITNVKPPLQIKLKADPDKGDPKGSSSRFVGTHEKLGVEMEFKGEISGMVGDKPYTGEFKEKEHKDHKHEKK